MIDQELLGGFKSAEDIREFVQIQKARTNLIDFAKHVYPGYEAPDHVVKIAEALQRVEAGEIRRLMIFMPPRHGKSLLCSQIFPCWFLGRDPKREIMCVSYNNDFATRFGRKTRGLFRSEEFREVFPGIDVSHESKAADNWELKYTSFEKGRERVRDGGVFQAAGIDGEVTGKGANLILIDDPVKGRANADSEAVRNSTWNFYESDLYSRQLSGCAIVLIQTRWHMDDLAGRLLERMKEGGEQWEILELPAILDKEEKHSLWPEKFPIEEMKRYKNTMTSRTWQSLYMQSPVADEGNIIKRAWWVPWADENNREKPLPEHWEFILLSVDTAYTIKDTSSYSAISVWGIFKQNNGTPGIMLLDTWRDRLEYPELRKKILEYSDEWNPDVLVIEKKASGQSLSQDMKRLLLPVVDFRPDKDKMTRAQSASPMIQAGLVFYVPNKYNQDMIDECAAFPTGKNDDLVDTMSQALIMIRENNYLNTKKLYRDAEESDSSPHQERNIQYY